VLDPVSRAISARNPRPQGLAWPHAATIRQTQQWQTRQGPSFAWDPRHMAPTAMRPPR
jgi:hypothetical protein